MSSKKSDDVGKKFDDKPYKPKKRTKKPKFSARPYKPKKPKPKKRRTDEEILTAARKALKTIKKMRRLAPISRQKTEAVRPDDKGFTQLSSRKTDNTASLGSSGGNHFGHNVHKPVRISEHPLLPMGFTSIARGQAESGAVFASDLFYAVCETKPLCFSQVLDHSAGKGIQPMPVDTLYSASIYYRKSKNPRGPSSLPIHVFGMTFINHELAMKPRGLWGKLTGKPFEPEKLALMHYSSENMTSLGSFDNDFDAISAYKLMIVKACEELVLHRNEFRYLGTLKEFGPDSTALQ
jgi:hypothetical protein